jgi:adiponectin receptor
VETLEDRYNEALTKETLAQKAQAGIWLMEVENGVHAVRDRGLSGALDEEWKAVDTGLTHAREAVDKGMGHARRAKDVLRDSVDRAIHLHRIDER